MTKKDAFEIIANLANQLNENDKKTFTPFMPLGKTMEQHKGNVLLTSAVGTREIQGADFTTLTFAPDNNVGPNVPFTIAYDSRSLYVDGVSLRDIGRDSDIETAVGNLAAFTVKDVEFTGSYPWKRSVAAEKLKYVDVLNDDMTNTDWKNLQELYDSSEDMQKAAEGINDIFEIVKVHITPISE
jgi:hypothetical protein